MKKVGIWTKKVLARKENQVIRVIKKLTVMQEQVPFFASGFDLITSLGF